MLREWRSWQADGEVVGRIEVAETALDLSRKLNAAMVRGRLFGGGAILIGDGAADPSQELVIDRIPQGGIQYLHVLSRYELTAGPVQRDPTSPLYGEPTYYEVRNALRQQRIHPSRVVRFLGAPLPDDVASQGDAWSDSILQAILDSVDQATSAAQHLAAMLPEAKQDIISVPGLSSWLATEADTTKLTERFAYAQRMKSMFGMLVLEGDGKSPEGEVYQQKQLSFAGLPDVARLFLQIASGAADIPVTRMLGQAPAGLNATGDSDTRNFYDHIAAKQKVELGPTIRRLDRIVLRHALGSEPIGVWYSWNPLYQLSEKEKAEVAKSVAETAKIYADAALVPEAVLIAGVRGRLESSDTFPGIEAAYSEHGDDPASDEAPDDLGPDGLPADSQQSGNVLPFRRQAVADAAPRTLYVSRKLKNADDVIAWAKSQGFTVVMPASEMHVTIAHSRQAVDWMKVAPTWQGEELKVDAGGPRLIETFGKAVVLLFASGDLQWRHREIREAGASWDHPEYQPHVTLTYDPGEVDLDAVQPYNGPLVFGPEIFVEVDEGWAVKVGGVKDALPFEGADEAGIDGVTHDTLQLLFAPEALELAGITSLTEDARRRGSGTFKESDHPRDGGGRFASKGGGKGGERNLKTSGITGSDEIVVLRGSGQRYRGHATVAEFVTSHPQGRKAALKALAADQASGTIGFSAPRLSSQERDRFDKAIKAFKDDGLVGAADYDVLVKGGYIKEGSSLDGELKAIRASGSGHIGSGRWAKAAGVREWSDDLDTIQEAHTASGIPFVKASRNRAVEEYSGEGYREINGGLRSGGALSRDTQSLVDRLDRLTAKSSFQSDTVMYRGFGKGAVIQNGAPPPRVFRDLGFTSVSYSPTAARNFSQEGGPLYRVRVPKGFPGIGIQRTDGGLKDALEDEAEVLLPRGTSYRIIKRVRNAAFGGTVDVIDVEPILPQAR